MFNMNLITYSNVFIVNCDPMSIYIIFYVSICLVVLLGDKGVRVSMPFINAFP
jgi:hypothetical protein